MSFIFFLSALGEGRFTQNASNVTGAAEEFSELGEILYMMIIFPE